MNSEHDEVRRWLETVFNKSGIPDYQLTPEGLEALNMIRKMSQEAEFREAQIREHKLREVREMEAETKRIKKFVQRTGLKYPSDASPSSLNPTSRFVDVLAEVSLELELDDPRHEELSLLLTEMQLEAAAIPGEEFERGRRAEERKERKMRALKDVSRNARMLNNASAEAKRELEAGEKAAKTTAFMKEKQKDYVRKVEKASSALRKAGFSDDVRHERLTELKAELDRARNEELAPLQARLKSYMDLPPDVELSRVKIAEAQIKLNELTHQLTKEISEMHV